MFPGFNLRTIYPTGFTPRFGQDSRDGQLTGGARGEIAGALRWDLSATYGQNEIEYFMENTINASLGPNSPTSFKPGLHDAGRIRSERGLRLPVVARRARETGQRRVRRRAPRGNL